jgi:membrane fusion protein, copper/silver efflux system
MKNIIAALLIILFSCKEKPKEEPNVFYTCSMDPQVMEKHPGNCPVCKMELTRTVVSDNKDQSIKLSDTQVKLANIQVEEVRLSNVEEGINLRGTVSINENEVNEISSRINGRIERLYFKTSGEPIKVGDHIYDIYSEELQAAIKEYLAAKEKAITIKGSAINFNDIVDAAKEKLILFDLSEKQIENLNLKNSSDLIPYYSKASGTISDILVKEGNYINEGSDIFKIVDLHTLWIEAEAYPNDMKFIHDGSPAKIKINGFSNEVINGKISFVNPALEKGSKINLVRIEISNADLKYKPGMQALISIISKIQKMAITVPFDAVLHEPKGNIIWIQNKNGGFSPRMVETGIQSGDMVEIKNGLREGEKVVISGAYLLNSEYVLRKGSDLAGNMPGMEGHDMKNMDNGIK